MSNTDLHVAHENTYTGEDKHAIPAGMSNVEGEEEFLCPIVMMEFSKFDERLEPVESQRC